MQMTNKRLLWLITLATLGAFGHAIADQTDNRHGATRASATAVVNFEGGVTLSFQHARDKAVDDELFASADLVTTLPLGPGELLMYIEGNTTPDTDGVGSLIGEANGDMGSALDKHDKGRLQISELHYTLPVGGAHMTLGLLDTTGFLDTNAVANDETSQFIGGSFVTNPLIEFPDYTIGGAYHRELGEKHAVTFVVTGSHGLGDNPDRSYDDLVDMDDDDKGIFTALEGRFALGDINTSVGVWLNTADHVTLDGNDTDADNYGVYSNLDFAVGAAAVNVRLGWANDRVSMGDTFIGLAAELPTAFAPVGIAIGRVGLADDAKQAGVDDTTHAEVYLRYAIGDRFHLSPSVQWLENSGFDSSDAVLDDSQLIYTLRANYTF